MIVRSSLYEDSTRTTLQEQSKEYSLKEYPQVKKDRCLKQYMKAAHRGLQESNLKELEKLYNVMC